MMTTARTHGRRRAALLSALVTATVAALIGFAGTASAGTLFTDGFEDGDATGWTTSGGSWSVGADGTQAYRQTGASSDARARTGAATWADYTVTARVKPTAFNGANRFVALLARAQSSTSYYYLALRSDSSLELKKLVNGGSTTLASVPTPVTAGTWYTLGLQVRGSHLVGLLDGAPRLSADDGQFTAGQVGVATYYASAAFDDVSVDGLLGPMPSASVTVSPSVSASPPASPSPSASPSAPPPAGQADGFASVNALGQNGTTGGAGGPTVTVGTTAELLAAIDTVGPMTIRVQGTINITSKQGVRPNKTIVGVGSTAVINGGGLDFYKSYNVIVRNISFTDADDDAINVGQNSHHIWIDHNSFTGPADGSIDVVRGSDYVTISWNHFRGTDKSMLIGHSDSNAGEDTGHLKVSIHHNWFDGSAQRHPRVRFGEPVHVYNNYYRANGLYGVVSAENAGVLVEGNYFEGVAYPCYSASGYADSGPGRLVERGNVFADSGVCESNGTVAEPGAFYPYRLDPAASVPGLVRDGAGIGRITP